MFIFSNKHESSSKLKKKPGELSKKKKQEKRKKAGTWLRTRKNKQLIMELP